MAIFHPESLKGIQPEVSVGLRFDTALQQQRFCRQPQCGSLPEIDPTNGNPTMKRLLAAILGLARILSWILIFYWMVFIYYTVEKAFVGGPNAVVTWYKHISGTDYYWSWTRFLTAQAGILAVTAVLYLCGRRETRRSRSIP